MKATYSSKEKLKSKILIDELFEKGKSVSSYPLRMVYIKTTLESGLIAKTGVSVSKKHFKKAVERNKIKRLLREVYRLNKSAYFNNITTQYALMILYIGNDKPTYEVIEHSMNKLFNKFISMESKN
jgi:ribonuclease P protein component